MQKKSNWPERIFLCGFMGSGKSTVGMKIAEYADKSFIDLDTVIVEQEGRPISDIFEAEGEEYFRKVERKMVRQACDSMQGIIALGGGALQNQQVVNWVKNNGILVFMSASLTNLIKRIYNDSGRPLLLDEEGHMKSKAQLEQELGARYRHRMKWYEQAQITVQTDQYESAEEVASELIQKINTYVSKR